MNKNHGGLVMEACGGTQCWNTLKRVMIPGEHVWFPRKKQEIIILTEFKIPKQREITQEGCSTDRQVTASTLTLSHAKHKP
jgi:hypothetical protein